MSRNRLNWSSGIRHARRLSGGAGIPAILGSESWVRVPPGIPTGAYALGHSGPTRPLDRSAVRRPERTRSARGIRVGEQPQQEQLDLKTDSGTESATEGQGPVQPGLFPDDSVPDALIGYRGPSACQIAGITYRQLDYWARTDLIRPSVTDAAGSGSRRSYSYRDLLELRIVKTLLDNGIKLESVRTVFRYLRDQLGEDIASAQLVIADGTAVLVREDELVDLLREGQFVMGSILSLGGVQREVDAAIVDLRPAQPIEVQGARASGD